MKKTQEYRFHIDAFTPSTFPMARLAEYMSDLAELLGHKSSVHFLKLEDGSTTLVHAIDREDVPKVQARLETVRQQDGPPEAMKARASLDKRLAEDNAIGYLAGSDGAEIIGFPGRNQPKPVTYGPVKQPGSLDGLLIRIGGKDKTVPVHILDEGDVNYRCNTTRAIARQLGSYLFRRVRVHGQGRWHRDGEGRWVMDRFDIHGFEVLQDTSLADAVAQLQAVEGSDWKTVDDPLAELQELRHGSDEVH